MKMKPVLVPKLGPHIRFKIVPTIKMYLNLEQWPVLANAASRSVR